MSQLVPVQQAEGPLGMWHLLSLDAPTVAALWTWFLARANHVSLPWTSVAAMAVAVWILYAADRLLDSRPLLQAGPDAVFLRELEPRHLFHHRHRRKFRWGLAAAGLMLAVLLPRIESAAVQLYLVEGGLLVAWFLILHATESAHRLPKEIAVGLFFAAATFIPTVARAPALRVALLPSAAALAMLCSLNCLYIYGWEHRSEGWEHRSEQSQGAGGDVPRPAHASTRFALRYLSQLASLGLVVCGTIAVAQTGGARLVASMCGVSMALLLLLDLCRDRLRPIPLRAAADLVLLTPLLCVPFLR